MSSDFCDADGARKLKEKIEEYWAIRGLDVDISLIDAGFVPSMRSSRTDVRSNMVNGRPPGKNAHAVPVTAKPKAPFAIRDRHTGPLTYWVR